MNGNARMAIAGWLHLTTSNKAPGVQFAEYGREQI